MAFVSMILAFLLIALLILGFMFFVGLILLIIGIVRKKSPKNQGKISPIICIVLGVLFMLPPVGTGMLVGGVMIKEALTPDKEYEIVTDEWREEYVSSEKAAKDVLAQLLEAADEGDTELIEKLFVKSESSKDKFKALEEDFLKNYPKGLAKAEVDKMGSSEGAQYRDGNAVKTCSASVRLTLDGEAYFIDMQFCFENDKDKDEVGLTSFILENLEASALDDVYNEGDALVCSIVSKSKVNARLINGKAFVYSDSARKLSQEKMAELLHSYKRLDDICALIGYPNASVKYDNCTGYDYYYELEEEDGRPLFVHITTSSPYGEILDNYLCSDTQGYYSRSL